MFGATVVPLVMLRTCLTPFLDYDGTFEERIDWLESGKVEIADSYGYAMTLGVEMVKFFMLTALFIVVLSPHRSKREDRWYHAATWINWGLYVAGAVVTVTVCPELRDPANATPGERTGIVLLAAALGGVINYVFAVSWR